MSIVCKKGKLQNKKQTILQWNLT